MNSTDHVIVTDDGGIRTIRMNRPDKKNALTNAMYGAMTAALNGVNNDDTIRCVMFAGVPGAFSAGNDVQDFLAIAMSPDGLSRPVRDFLPALVHCNKPMVAAVSGLAVGIGTTMLFHCDYVVAGSDAKFTTPFSSLGLIPEAASTLTAPRAMGHARAFELLVMGRPFDAVRAREAGFVNAIVAPADVDAEALKAAREIAALPPGAIATSRRLLRGERDVLVARIDEETELFKMRLQSPEARKAFEAFLTRKK
jgi:enoyl-CoA hydratase/carnithine racemase